MKDVSRRFVTQNNMTLHCMIIRSSYRFCFVCDVIRFVFLILISRISPPSGSNFGGHKFNVDALELYLFKMKKETSGLVVNVALDQADSN